MSRSPSEYQRLSGDDAYRRGLDELNARLLAGGTISGHERNCAYLNTRGSRFANVSAVTGLDFDDDGRATAVVDWDHDGDLDLWSVNRTAPAVRFLRNSLPRDHRYVSLRLVGETCNRDAIGARVSLKLAGDEEHTFAKTVCAGNGYLSQSSKRLHFNLGDAKQISRLQVRWPNGELEEIEPPELDARYVIKQGTGRAVSEDFVARQLPDLPPTAPTCLPETEVARIVVNQALTLPSTATYQVATGERRSLKPGPDRHRLVVLWSMSCPNCEAELPVLAGSAERLEAAGIDITLLNVDLGETSSSQDRTAVANWLKEHDMALPSHSATPELLDAMEQFDTQLLARKHPLPVPLGVLIAPSDRVTAIYKGRVQPDQILDDTNLWTKSRAAIRDAAAPFPGRWSRDIKESVDTSSEVLTRRLFTDRRVLFAAIVAACGAVAGLLYLRYRKRSAV